MIQIVDFETTGLGTKETPAQPIQYGQVVLYDDLTLCEDELNELLIRPNIPIEYGAMGIHQITNEYINQNYDFDYSEVSDGKWVLPATKYLISHNAQYDTKFINKEQLSNVKVVCTLKLARKLIDKTLCVDHKNMTLYYFLGCYKNPLGGKHIGKSHSALSDAMVTTNVLLAMLSKYNLTIDQAYAMITNIDESNPVLEDINICPFPKHAGKTWVEVIKADKDYCQWLLGGGKIKNPAMVELVRGLM